MSGRRYKQIHHGRIFQSSKNNSGVLVWIPKRLAEKVGLKVGDEIVIVAFEDRVVVMPWQKFTDILVDLR